MRSYEHVQIDAGEDRRQLTVKMRSEGRTFREIADKLGVSVSRASQLYNRALELQFDRQRAVASAVTSQTPIDELPISERTLDALRYGGYRTLGDIMPLDLPKERSLLMLPNFARVSLEEVRTLIATLD